MDRVFINKQFLLSKQAANSEIDDVNICCVQCQESEEVLDYVFAEEGELWGSKFNICFIAKWIKQFKFVTIHVSSFLILWCKAHVTTS